MLFRSHALTCAYAYRSRLGDGIWEGVLQFDKFRSLLKEHKIVFPSTTEAEIDDRSKGDALSKGIALLQITWFIIQLIARRVQGLTITELELTTVALAGLNSVMYVFWWNKPLDVRCPIVVRTKTVEQRLARGLFEGALDSLRERLAEEMTLRALEQRAEKFWWPEELVTDDELQRDVERLLAEITERPVLDYDEHDWSFENPREFKLGSYVINKYVLLQLLEMR